MIQEARKKSRPKKSHDYLNVGLINSLFVSNCTALEKMVSIIIASETKFGIYAYSTDLSEKSGCAVSTAKNAIASLIKAGCLSRKQRGKYELKIEQSNKYWLNLRQFKMALATRLNYVQKLVLLAAVKYIPKDSDICYPKLATLCKQCSLAEDTVSIALSELKQAGLIDRYKEANKWWIKSLLPGKKFEIKTISEGDAKATSEGICNKMFLKNKKLKQRKNKNESLAFSREKNKAEIKPAPAIHEIPESELRDLLSIWHNSIEDKADSIGKETNILRTIHHQVLNRGGDPLDFVGFIRGEDWETIYRRIKSKYPNADPPKHPDLQCIAKYFSCLWLMHHETKLQLSGHY